VQNPAAHGTSAARYCDQSGEAGCKPQYAPVVRAALLALAQPAFNLNGVQATTHYGGAAPRRERPDRRRDRHEPGANAFGSGNRANATIGRAIRLVLLNVGGAWPGDLDKATLGTPANTPMPSPRTRPTARGRLIISKRASPPRIRPVFVIAAEPPHSVTNHVADDPEGILDSICSAMSTIANNNAVSSGHCAVVIGPEHAKTIAGKGWTRHDVRNYLHMNAWNLFGRLAFDHRYGGSTTATCRAGTSANWIHDPDRAEPRHIHLFVIAARPAGSRPSSRAGATCRRRCCAASKGAAATARRSVSTAPVIIALVIVRSAGKQSPRDRPFCGRLLPCARNDT